MKFKQKYKNYPQIHPRHHSMNILNAKKLKIIKQIHIHIIYNIKCKRTYKDTTPPNAYTQAKQL